MSTTPPTTAPPSIPSHAKILIIGGGPAGSYAASLFQREGHDVVLMESSKFPRYHVGESMLPSLRNYVRFIGLEEEFVKHGFVPKPGACFKLVQDLRPSWTNFTALGPDYGTWNVIRSEMDTMLLNHASSLGAQVFQETRVDSLSFSPSSPSPGKPISATYTHTPTKTTGTITFDWLVDASGRNGIMSTKYLKNRVMRESLRNVAVWGYWRDVKRFEEGTVKEGSGWFEALTDQKGWAWVIPLHDGTTSIGFVMHKTLSDAKKSTPLASTGAKPSLTEHYLDQLQFTPGVRDLIGEKGNFIEGSTKSAADYSYFAEKYSGENYRIVGDAANFVDPFFSSGVHIAMTGALSAVVTILASMNGQVDEKLAQAWHDEKVGIAHTRFLFVVLSAYQQMHLQSVPVLSDISEDNFDKAFDMFRPVIWGLADSSNRLTSSKVSHMLTTLQPFFDPTIDDSNVRAVKERYSTSSIPISMESPVLGEKIKEIVKEGDDEAERVLRKFDALKVFSDDVEATYMGRQVLLGYKAVMERGKLGLVKGEEGVKDQARGEEVLDLVDKVKGEEEVKA